MSDMNNTGGSLSGETLSLLMARVFGARCATLVALALSLCCLTSFEVRAERATPQEMEQVCKNWLTHVVFEKGAWGGEPSPQITDLREITVNDTVLARCFSIAPSGYVVVPVLKELPPVKAYSEECSLDVNQVDGMAQLLKDVLLHRVRLFVKMYGALEASQPSQGDVLLGRDHRQQWDRFSIDRDEYEAGLNRGAMVPMEQGGPLLTTSWDQNPPYNNYCPVGCYDQRCVVGCVATAAAQIMAYHQWPPLGNGTETYYWPGDDCCAGNPGAGYLSADFSDEYDWANIPDDCSPNCTQEERDALAELCYEVGVAFYMDYGVCGSGAYTADAVSVYPSHFRYHQWIDKEDRAAHTSGSWFNLIKAEVNEGRPMQYRIHSHSIVCDGWREVGGLNQYHMNYGWDDSHTNWYTIDELYCPWSGCDPYVEFMIRYIIPDRGIMFAADTTFGWVPFDVNFTGSSEYSVDEWIWDFGDGDSVFVQSPLHTYNTPGMFDVTLAVDTGGDTLSLQRSDYIIALADSMIVVDIAGSSGDTVEMAVYAKNATPLTTILIPIETFGTLNATHSYGAFSTAGCRSEYFETQMYQHFDPAHGRYTFKLQTSSSDLPPGEGCILKLYFVIPGSASPGQIDTVEVDGYNQYLPWFSGSVAEYQAVPVAGTISLSDCCMGMRGNVDGDPGEAINVADLTYLVDHLFFNGPEPPCLEEGDVTGDGALNVADLTCFVDYLFFDVQCIELCP